MDETQEIKEEIRNGEHQGDNMETQSDGHVEDHLDTESESESEPAQPASAEATAIEPMSATAPGNTLASGSTIESAANSTDSTITKPDPVVIKPDPGITPLGTMPQPTAQALQSPSLGAATAFGTGSPQHVAPSAPKPPQTPKRFKLAHEVAPLPSNEHTRARRLTCRSVLSSEIRGRATAVEQTTLRRPFAARGLSSRASGARPARGIP